MSIRGSRTVGMTRLVFFTLLVVSQIIALACCAEIDPKVYARVFEVSCRLVLARVFEVSCPCV